MTSRRLCRPCLKREIMTDASLYNPFITGDGVAIIQYRLVVTYCRSRPTVTASVCRPQRGGEEAARPPSKSATGLSEVVTHLYLHSWGLRENCMYTISHHQKFNTNHAVNAKVQHIISFLYRPTNVPLTSSTDACM